MVRQFKTKVTPTLRKSQEMRNTLVRPNREVVRSYQTQKAPAFLRGLSLSVLLLFRPGCASPFTSFKGRLNPARRVFLGFRRGTALTRLIASLRSSAGPARRERQPPNCRLSRQHTGSSAGAGYLAAERCLLTSLVISNMETCFLPNSFISLSSALIMRRFALSCRPFFLM